MKLRKRIMALALGALGCAGVLTTAAFAETGTPEKSTVEAGQAGDSTEKTGTAIDMHDGKLTVKTVFGTDPKSRKPIDGINVSIYQIASIDEAGKYTVTEEFAGADLGDVNNINLTRSDYNDKLRGNIKTYLAKDGVDVTPSGSAVTENGTAAFDISADGSETGLGLYYVEGDILERTEEGHKYFYIPGSALVSIPSPPNVELDTKYWDYLPTVNIKCTKGDVYIDPPVLKVIEEKGDPVGQGRDFTFVMQALKGAPIPNPDEYGWKLEENGTVLKMTYPAAKQKVIAKDGKTTKTGESQEFGHVWFTQPGLYEYLIYEMKENATGYSFDETQYRLCANVILQKDGTLGGEQWYETIKDGKVIKSGDFPLGPGLESPFEFTNTYTYNSGDTYFDPYVRNYVHVTDRAIDGDLKFKFILEAKEGTPMPGGSTVKNGIVTKEIFITINQMNAMFGVTAPFGRITFDGPGTYSYKVYEDKATTDKLPYVQHDKTLYEVEVTTDGKNITGIITKDGKPRDPADWTNKAVEFPFGHNYIRGGSSSHGGGGGGSSVRRLATPSSAAPTTPAETEPEVIPGMLPKTGMLWWPVPVLAVAGIFLLAAGFILERRRS